MNTIKKLEQKIPLIIRATIAGFSVSTIGIALWIGVASFIPSPWFLIVIIIILGVYWKYFSGSWGLRQTKIMRAANFRSTKLSTRTWKYGLLSAGILVILLQSSIVLTFRLIEYPSEHFKQSYTYLGNLPTGMAWLVLIMSSLVAGICEEIGYRGYLQAPLEKKYNLRTANIITSVVFVIIHLHQAWAAPVILHIFLISMALGYLAQTFSSLIPGIIAHSIFDIFNFSYWWSDVLGEFTRKPISITGIDSHFILTILMFMFSLIAFFGIIKKYKKNEFGEVSLSQ